MSNIHKNPYDSVDLSLLLPSYDESIGTLYPLAYVYDPNGNLVSGAPFALTLLANNLYVKRSAFNADVQSGTYLVIYEVYTDAGHTTKSGSFGQQHDTISVSIQSTTGLGSGGGGNFYDDTGLIAYIKEEFKKLNAKYDKLQKDFDDGLKVEVPKVDVSESNKQIIELINLYNRSNKSRFEDLADAIRKNRNTIIKSKFDKTMMTPIFAEIIDGNIKMLKEIKSTKIELTKIIDIKNEKLDEMNRKNIEKAMLGLYEVIDNFNESMRTKLKYVVDIFRVFTNQVKETKHNVKITLKKDDL